MLVFNETKRCILKRCLCTRVILTILILEATYPSSRGDTATGSANGSDGGGGNNPECRLFLAESTIPHAGLGIFTGIDLNEGDPIAENDLIIPLHDLYWHAKDDIDYDILWHQYAWMPKELNMQYDMNVMDGNAIVLGTGCMPNCNFALINAYEGKAQYDHAGLHRSKDAGTSGITGFHNQMYTKRFIPTGGEIFVNYGEQWFDNRVDDVGAVPYESHFHAVDIFLTAFKRMSLLHSTNFHRDNTFTRDLWSVVMSLAVFDTRNGNALPWTFEDMQLAYGTSAAESRQPHSIRTREWLLEHGRCMDNIRPGKSNIPQAGRGAFATRFIPKGGLIAPGPVLHMANRTSLNIYEEGNDGMRDKSKHISMQLLLNYCFGHAQSTVLLCPYTSPSAYINHSHEHANVKVVWASNSTINHNSEWLEEDVDFLKLTEKVGLSLDFIATRDIYPDEEVLLNYGREWQAAWDKYMDEWTPPPNSEKYTPASMISEPLRTVQEQVENPYPSNVVFYCHYDDEPNMTAGRWSWNVQWTSIVTRPCKILSRRAVKEDEGEEDAMINPVGAERKVGELEEEEIEHKRTTFTNDNIATQQSMTSPSPATIVRYYYTMAMLTADEILQSSSSSMGDEGYILPKYHIPNNEKDQHILLDVPRNAIWVQDRPYAKDEFFTGKYAFRHEMMLSDEVFPEAWKNNNIIR